MTAPLPTTEKLHTGKLQHSKKTNNNKKIVGTVFASYDAGW